MNFQRASGILLHPTSLPGDYGIGDFGSEAYKFVDFLAVAKQTYWQILPLGPTGYGDSPYQCFSAFAGNTNLISPQKLAEENLLTIEEINAKPDFPAARVDYGAIYEYKKNILWKAFARLPEKENLKNDLAKFAEDSKSWLDDYALFRVIRNHRDQKSWNQWEKPLATREENALEKARQEFSNEVEAEKFFQFLFFRQWFELKRYANEKGVKIVGDIPIFVAFDSSDVWCNPKIFKLSADGTPRVVSGVPPDFFSSTGQLWGNPLYDWDALREDNFGWWIGRFRASFAMFDVVRIDHFRGFAACWEVPAQDKTAQNGSWVEVPGHEFFNALENALGDIPVFAEDLGVITSDVEKLRDSFGFPSMKILQFAFGGDAKNGYLPHNYTRRAVVYTGNHDNDTTAGWFEKANEHERWFCQKYLHTDGGEIYWCFIRAALESVANTAIIPMQDLLGLGSEARMNLPASMSGNWAWRCRTDDFNNEIAGRLRELTEIYGRKF